ncbi:MAG: hypothetical protein JMDDDDMK_04619 [Acidobacteria bacterium]|nr:hypothetical protein [Acidobacteriota bacterium]
MLFLSALKRSARLLLIAALTTGLITTANATIMQYLDIEDLTRLSSDIFHGQVVSTSVYWNAERTSIYTAIRVRIGETFKGSTRRDQIVTVTQPGGEKDGIRMDYAGRPEFAAGESVALFTIRGKRDDFIVVGLKQGKMRVERSEVIRDFSGITLVDGAGRGKSLRPVNLKSTRLTVDELRNRIARVR